MWESKTARFETNLFLNSVFIIFIRIREKRANKVFQWVPEILESTSLYTRRRKSIKKIDYVLYLHNTYMYKNILNRQF